MTTKDPTPCRTSPQSHELIDPVRMADAARTAGNSAEALFSYLSRLDSLRCADLDRAALADRAAKAELHTRLVLNAGLEGLNELNDLGLLNLNPTAKDLRAFNGTKLSDAVVELAAFFRESLPEQRWDWLEDASRLVDEVELKAEMRDGILCGTITHAGQSTLVRFDPKATATRVSTEAFFSNGAERIYVPTSGFKSATDRERSPGAAYNAAIGAMAFTREWVYRHARNAAELGVPERSGGGPVLVVIVIVLVVVAALATIAVAILAIACAAGSDTSCRLALYLGIAASVLNGGAEKLDEHTGQPPILKYGTNPP